MASLEDVIFAIDSLDMERLWQLALSDPVGVTKDKCQANREKADGLSAFLYIRNGLR